MFRLRLKTFILKDAYPNLHFTQKKKKFQIQLCGPLQFSWFRAGDSCARDIFRISNLTRKMANRFYGETTVKALFPTSHTVTREDLVNPNIQTINQIIELGETWWAPILDEIYKSKDGRDLNLEVICKIMVIFLYFSCLFYIFCKFCHVCFIS